MEAQGCVMSSTPFQPILIVTSLGMRDQYPFFCFKFNRSHDSETTLEYCQRANIFFSVPQNNPNLIISFSLTKAVISATLSQTTSLGTQKRHVGHTYCISEKTLFSSFSEYVLCASPGSGINKPDHVRKLHMDAKWKVEEQATAYQG